MAERLDSLAREQLNKASGTHLLIRRSPNDLQGRPGSFAAPVQSSLRSGSFDSVHDRPFEWLPRWLPLESGTPDARTCMIDTLIYMGDGKRSHRLAAPTTTRRRPRETPQDP
ncbi:hypothetical protein Misp02_68440 [Microtetraspora sp. NBRC 16547]|nr:hypothetical protein Misp02_68440 [Microtetraspora sp. NBRC 16547]